MKYLTPLSDSFYNVLICDNLYACTYVLLNVIVYILFPFIVLTIVYTGFLFLVAQGNPEKITRAKNAFVWVLVGALVILGSKALALAIEATVQELTI